MLIYTNYLSLLNNNSDISKRDDEQLIKSGDNTDTSSAVTTRNNGSGQDGTDDPEYGYDCYPVGPCDLCTSFEQKTEAICQKTGNKEPINCKPLDPPPSKSLGPKPSFRSCVVVKRLEKSRFFKFQTFNIFIAIGTLLLIYWRRRKLQYFFQRKIARRIAQV
ncbi:hypothetical protein BDF19DRAFT_453001 [Syncephalis fuscata]|nr:hypothetical protein BDF19DRAFT_453001 [Syncephalis fuscata]